MNAYDFGLKWGNDPTITHSLIWDGGFVLLGDSSGSLTSVVELRADFRCYNRIAGNRRFLPELNSNGECGFDSGTDVVMGYKRTGGCPGSPVPIEGSWVRSFYSDTNSTVPSGDPSSSMGILITQTDVGANDPIYGDFKLTRWQLDNQRDTTHPRIYGGTHLDWDAPSQDFTNYGIISREFNGYAVWDGASPGNAYGAFDPNQPSLGEGVDPDQSPPHNVYLRDQTQDYSAPPPPWEGCYDFVSQDILGWNSAINETWRNELWWYVGTDRAGWLISGPFVLPAHGSIGIHQVFFAVDATSNDPDVIEDLASDVAARAARWAGFARGDVNDDGLVDLYDVLWLEAGYPIYPDTYCGDVNLDGIVDASDIAQLVQWISGDASAQPQGEWRFTF